MKKAFVVLLIFISSLSVFAETGSKYVGGVMLFTDGTEVTESMAAVTVEAEFSETTISDATRDFVFSAVNSGAVSIPAATNGVLRITTGGANDDDAELASSLMWTPRNYASMVARIRVNTATLCAFNVGFTDAQTEAADLLPITISAGTVTTTASNAALIVADSDQTTDLIRAQAVNDDTDATLISSTTVFAPDAWYTIQVDLNADGDATFWLDGNYIGQAAAGIDTNQTLCAYVGFITREGSAHTMDVDYVRVWQQRNE